MKDAPDKLISWKKDIWHKGDKEPAAHPNSRFTVPIEQAPNLAKEYDDKDGVLISAILVGGRRANTIPLVTEAFSYNHGIFMGSMMGSEITAAAISDSIGKVRRDPFAMLPFIGYHIKDYFNHWFNMKGNTNEALLPKIYYVNWFRKDEQGNFIWPGFGENSRVLKWIFERSLGTASGKITPIGIMPDKQDLDLTGLNITDKDLDTLFEVDKKAWLDELLDLEAYYKSLGDIPKALYEELYQERERLNKLGE